jgi:hypothetical protein
MPQLGQVPGLELSTSGHIGQKYAALVFGVTGIGFGASARRYRAGSASNFVLQPLQQK